MLFSSSFSSTTFLMRQVFLLAVPQNSCLFSIREDEKNKVLTSRQIFCILSITDLVIVMRCLITTTHPPSFRITVQVGYRTFSTPNWIRYTRNNWKSSKYVVSPSWNRSWTIVWELRWTVRCCSAANHTSLCAVAYLSTKHRLMTAH